MYACISNSTAHETHSATHTGRSAEPELAGVKLLARGLSEEDEDGLEVGFEDAGVKIAARGLSDEDEDGDCSGRERRRAEAVAELSATTGDGPLNHVKAVVATGTGRPSTIRSCVERLGGSRGR